MATPQAAQRLVRARMKEYAGAEGGAIVWLHEGRYDLSATMVFDERDSGKPGRPVVWKRWASDNVSFTGGKTLNTGRFKPCCNGTDDTRVKASGRSEILEFDLHAAGISDLGRLEQYGHARAVVPAPAEVFFNDVPLTLARYPNVGGIPIGEVIDAGSVPRIGDKSGRGAVFRYTDGRHRSWAGLQDVWLQGTFNYGFADDIIRVQHIDTVSGTVTLASPHLYGVAHGKDFQRYVAWNILSELDQPGEYFIDRERGKLYLWPPSDIRNAVVTMSVLEDPIVALEGVSHLQLEGLTVEAGRGIGIYMEGGSNNKVTGCVVRNVGTTGIFMGQGARADSPDMSVDDHQGAAVSRWVGDLQNHIYRNTAWDRLAGRNHRIQSCDVYNTGSGGIYLSGGSKRDLVPGGNVVENCRVHDYNRRNKFLWSGINVDGVGNQVRHCEVYGSDWQGIYVHGNDHLFEFNDIHHVTLDSDDTSPWYIGRDPSDRGNVLRYNHFHDCGNPARMNMGIYCDDSSTGVTVYGNVFENMAMKYGMLFSNTGWDLKFQNNIVVNPLSKTAVISAHYYTWAAAGVPATFGPSGLIRKRLTEAVRFDQPPYATRYPELLPYLDVIIDGKEWQGMRSRGNLMENNLIVGGDEDPVGLLGGEHARIESRGNWVTQDDPGFADLKRGDYTLRRDAEAFRRIPGFQPVPFRRMGIYPDVYRPGFRR